jgi:hypothetical protein
MSGEVVGRIEQSFLEYRAVFREPIFAGWDPQGRLAPSLYAAFKPWNIGLENVSWKSLPGKANEIEIQFSLFNSRIVFTVGLGSASLAVTNPKPSDRDLLVQIAGSGLGAVQSAANADIDKHIVVLSMHVKLLNKTLREVTEPFVQVRPAGTQEKPIRACGFSVYREDGFWVADLSTVVTEGLFARILRVFPADTALADMAGALDQEETAFWDTLKMRFE